MSNLEQNVLTEREALEIIAFLVSSAEICIREPTYYGTFRLVDGASRLIGLMLPHGCSETGDFLTRLKTEIDAKKTMMMRDREGYYRFLEALPAQVAEEMKRMGMHADQAAGS